MIFHEHNVIVVTEEDIKKSLEFTEALLKTWDDIRKQVEAKATEEFLFKDGEQNEQKD
jgi:ABC-type nitrate/sulfonate/bicarbonate transport system substrate-binding protein